MINVGAREWQSGLWFVNNDKRRGTVRRAPTSDVNGSLNTFLGILRICWGFVPVSLDSRLHGNDNRGYDLLIMINVGARRAVPLQVMWTVSPNTVSGILRICWGFEPVSLDSRLHGNDNRGYDLLIMINVWARRAVPLQMMWTVSRNTVSGILLDKEISCYH